MPSAFCFQSGSFGGHSMSTIWRLFQSITQTALMPVAFAGVRSALRQQRLHHVAALRARECLVPAFEIERDLVILEAQQVHDGRVQIVDINRVLAEAWAKFPSIQKG